MPKKRRSTRKLLDVNDKEIRANLEQLTNSKAISSFTEATRAGANVFKRKLARNAPDSGESHKNKLKDSFKVKKKKFNKRGEAATWVLSTAPYAHLVEFGTVAREPKNPHWAFYDDELHFVTYNGVMHQDPFFRREIDNKDNQARAKTAMGQTLVKSILRKLKKAQGNKDG